MGIVSERLQQQRNASYLDPKTIAATATGQNRNLPPASAGPSSSVAPLSTSTTSPTSSSNNLYAGTNLDAPNDAGFFGTFFAKKKKGGVLENPPPVLKPSGNLSEREYMEVEVIKLLIQSYYNIVKRTVADLVPKAVMLYLVNHSKEELQRELLSELYKKDLMEDVLKESDFTVQRRKECRKMIEALQKADEIISSV